MADVLSQSEIDALLNALSTGEVDLAAAETPEVKVRSYDFRTANRFSKEQMRTLNIIYDTFCRLFTTYLSGTLRAMCQVEVVGVEELKYHEFVNALPSPVVLAIVTMPPLLGPTLLEISPDVAYSMISRLLGGGSNSGGETNRSFTEIELVLLERIMRQFINLLPEAWEKVLSIDATLDRLETSPQFAQIVALNETVAVITLNVRVGDNEGLLNICLPHLTIEPINKQLNTRALFQTTIHHERAPATADIQFRLRNTPLTVSAVFNDTPASVGEIMSLQVGDVLQLDHRVGEPLTLKVGHLPKFRAALGVRDNKYAVKIADLIREEDLDHE